MVQHDQLSSNGTSNESLGDSTGTIDPQDVTRKRGGQFYMESEGLTRPSEEVIEAEGEASLDRDGTGTINALQVTMTQSGAEHVHSQKVFMTNSGAQKIDATSTKMNQSGAVQLRSDKAELHQSSVVLMSSDDVQMEGGSIIFSTSETASLGEGASVTLMQARTVEAAGNIHAFMILSNDVKAGADVRTTFDLPTAAMAGGVFGMVFALVWKLIRPRG